MNHFKLNVHAALLVAGLLATPALLLAQSPPQEMPSSDLAAPPPSDTEEAEAAPQAQVEEAKVDQFADAYVAVQQIQAQAAQELSATQEADKQIEVKANAEKEMVRAVERSGLQIEEFNSIASLMTTDLSLRSKVIEKVQQRSKG